MVDARLIVRFEGPNISEEGVSLDDLQKTLRYVQDAMRLMVRHLADYRKPGRLPNRLQRESKLRLIGASPGSLVAELGLASSDEHNPTEGYGRQAIARIVGAENVRSLPESVGNALSRIAANLSPEVAVVQLADPHSGRHVEFWREVYVAAPMPAPPVADAMERALVHGRLRAVDWEERTAKLVPYQGRPIDLRFDASHDRQMLELAMQYVEVRGQGRFDSYDQWRYIQVEEVRGTRSWNEPFDLEAFLNDPNPKIFDPDKVIRASEPFDVDEFIQFIKSSRKDNNA